MDRQIYRRILWVMEKCLWRFPRKQLIRTATSLKSQGDFQTGMVTWDWCETSEAPETCTKHLHHQWQEMSMDELQWITSWWCQAICKKLVKLDDFQKGFGLKHAIRIKQSLKKTTWIPAPSKGSQMVSIHHPLGFNAHPFEGLGT